MVSDTLKAVLDRRLWGAAEKVIAHYQSNGYNVTQLQRIDETLRQKSHIVCKKRFETIAIDIRERCNIERYYEDFVIGCQARRIAVKFYYAIPERINDVETPLTHSQLIKIKELGIGLITVTDNGSLVIDPNTISCDRRFALPVGTSLGKHSKKIKDLIDLYNLGSCLEAVRNLSEEAEDATMQLALKAIRKGKINLTASEINNHSVDWNGIINILTIPLYKGVTQTRIITDNPFKTSLNSVRDKRNLSDHRKTAKQIRQLEEQFPEAMVQGIRVIRELVRITNNLR